MKKKDGENRFVAIVGLKAEKWQDDVLSKHLFPVFAEFQNRLNREVNEWFSTLFEDRKFKVSWKHPRIAGKLGCLDAIRDKILEKGGPDVLDDADRKFLEKYESRKSELEGMLAECRSFHPEAKDDEMDFACLAYCRREACGWMEEVPGEFNADGTPVKRMTGHPINLKWVESAGVAPAYLGDMGLVSLAGNVRSHGVSDSGKTYVELGLNGGMARSCGKRVWAAWSRRVGAVKDGFRGWANGVRIDDVDPGSLDTISFDQCKGVSIDDKSSPPCLVVNAEGFRGRDRFKLRLPLEIGGDDGYMAEVVSRGLSDRLRAVSVSRVRTGSGWEYYAHLTFIGDPPAKDLELGKGVVGVDPGPSGFTYWGLGGHGHVYFGDDNVIPGFESKIADIRRKMDASDRAMNPDLFNPDGTPVRGARGKRRHSKAWYRMNGMVADLKRREREHLKNICGRAINHGLMKAGDEFVVEKSKIDRWAMRKEKPDDDDPTGKKKQYGRSIGMYAPSTFISRLLMTAARYGARVRLVDDIVAATKFNAAVLDFDKEGHDPSERVLDRGGVLVDRDYSSAFNLAHVVPDDRLVRKPVLNRNGTVKTKGGQPVTELARSKDNYDLEAMARDWPAFLATPGVVVGTPEDVQTPPVPDNAHPEFEAPRARPLDTSKYVEEWSPGDMPW